jgi:predicted membrane-bound spermidine synthase
MIFFQSGAAALIYQIAWQRALFVIYGLDAVSATIVVTAFMLGLGLGSLAGGVLSKAYPQAAVVLFAASEVGIAIFGYFSLDLFDVVAGWTVGIGYVATGIVAFLLVVIPTTLMGATLPLLVAHGATLSGNVGRSVGTLYFANTLGAAAGAYFAATVLLRELGLSGTVHAAAALNAWLGAVVFCLAAVERRIS